MKNKRITYIIILSLAIILSLKSCSSPVYATPYSVKGYTYRDIFSIEKILIDQEEQMLALHRIAESARDLGYEEDHSIILSAKDEYMQIKAEYIENQEVYNALIKHFAEKEYEYPNATYIWKKLLKAGYSEPVAAGIIGNLMVETGGLTLDIDPKLKTNSYYGICQWSKEYSKIWGTNLEEQCNFLLITIKSELDTYGYLYKKGFDHSDFLKMTNPKETALMFSKCYERNSSSSYKIRQNCAINAYNYFIS